ncbi:hypothetical protein CC78DRAFT_477217, partial [Lojkania enalia]
HRLRRKVFPNGGRWRDPNPKLYFKMKQILRTARDELNTALTEHLAPVASIPSA